MQEEKETYPTLNVGDIEEKREPSLSFYVGEGHPWFVRFIRYDGAEYPVFEVNRELYPDSAPDDFARAFLEILEQHGFLKEYIDEMVEQKLKERGNI